MTCVVCARPAEGELCADASCERLWRRYLRDEAEILRLEARGRHEKADRIRERGFQAYARHRLRVNPPAPEAV